LSTASSSIAIIILRSGVAGFHNDTLQMSVRRGYSQQEGATSETRSVTYYWSPVSFTAYDQIEQTHVGLLILMCMLQKY